ncbi:MAG: hypothetical protein ACE5K4_03870 [Candidatus Hydrothermarchaeota archaeon]
MRNEIFSLVLLTVIATPVFSSCLCGFDPIYLENGAVHRSSNDAIYDTVTRKIEIPIEEEYYIKIISYGLSKLYINVQRENRTIYEVWSVFPGPYTVSPQPNAVSYFRIGNLSPGEIKVTLTPGGPNGAHATLMAGYFPGPG